MFVNVCRMRWRLKVCLNLWILNNKMDESQTKKKKKLRIRNGIHANRSDGIVLDWIRLANNKTCALWMWIKANYLKMNYYFYFRFILRCFIYNLHITFHSKSLYWLMQCLLPIWFSSYSVQFTLHFNISHSTIKHISSICVWKYEIMTITNEIIIIEHKWQGQTEWLLFRFCLFECWILN